MAKAKIGYNELRRLVKERGITGLGSSPKREVLEKALTRAGKRPVGRPVKVPTDLFVSIVNGARTSGEAQAALNDEGFGVSAGYVAVRASNLRKKGVDVKEFQRGRKPADQPSS